MAKYILNVRKLKNMLETNTTLDHREFVTRGMILDLCDEIIKLRKHRRKIKRVGNG